MGLLSFVNKSIINSKLSDIIAKYDTDKNGFNKKEFHNVAIGITNKLARSFIKITGYDKTLFKELNTNNDDVISYDELANYVKNEYGLDFFSFKNMTILEICNAIDNAKKNKKSSLMEQDNYELNKIA